MKAENLIFDYSCQGQVIEELCELFPNVCVAVFPQAFIIKSIHLCDLSTLMVASKNSESVLEADFQSDKECHSLDRVVTTIDVVAHEQVVGIRWLSTNLEQFSEIMELPMDVSTNCDGCTDLLDIRLVNKDFFRLFAEKFDLLLW